MAFGGSDILKLIVDADTSGAVSEFKKLGSTIETSGDKAATGFKGALTKAFDGLQSKSSAVSGIFEKIGVSSEQAAGVISAAIPAAGVAAAGALVAFAAKGVAAFQETALAAGKFADTTGLSVETASRYVAIADDIGVGAGTIQNAFVKMEKAMGANKSAFTDLIATSKSGGTDLSQTFLNAVTHLQGIEDPIKRATESSKLFGKGFAEVSELINTDAGTIVDSLSKVSDAQLITPEELKSARDYRAAMDNLKDTVGDAGREIGKALVPELTKLAGFAATGIEIVLKFKESKEGGILNKINEIAGKVGANPLAPLQDSLQQIQDHFDKTGKAAGEAAGNVSAFAGTAGSDAARVAAAMKEGEQAILGLNTASSEFGTAAGDFERLSTAANHIVTSTDMIPISADAAANSISRTGSEFGDLAAKTKAANDALQTNINLVLEAEGGALAVSAAQREFNKAIEDNTKVQQDSKATTDDKAAALDRETSAALATAEATVAYAQKQEEAQGKTLDAKGANDLLIGTLYGLANKASPEVQAALGDVITKLQETGAQHPEPTVSLNDQATPSLDTLMARLHTFDAASYAASLGVNTSAGNLALDRLQQRLNNAAGASVAVGTGGHVVFAKGGMVPGPKGGAVAATVHGGEYVLPTGLVDAIKQGRPPGPTSMASVSTSGGTVINLVVNGAVDPYSTARQIQTILAKGGYAGFSAKAA